MCGFDFSSIDVCDTFSAASAIRLMSFLLKKFPINAVREAGVLLPPSVCGKDAALSGVGKVRQSSPLYSAVSSLCCLVPIDLDIFGDEAG